MFDIVDRPTAFSYAIELVVCLPSFCRIPSSEKEVASNLYAMHILCFYSRGKKPGMHAVKPCHDYFGNGIKFTIERLNGVFCKLY